MTHTGKLAEKYADWTPKAITERLAYRRETMKSAQREVAALLRARKIQKKREKVG